MPAALLDTNVLFATASARDTHHDTAREIVSGVDRGQLPEAVVVDYVLAETVNLCTERLGADIGTQLLDRLTEGLHFEICRISKRDFETTRTIYRQYEELSFVDASLAAYIRRADIKSCTRSTTTSTLSTG
ncbi:MAG: putative nucleic acid-binding protein, contains PIN domain protein [halophilic archaeon J07HB67]|jgi:Predicted nucleic acid-binding protein, contains PIN domain|nr:MAG: putative nucleic acid-binding protein, contains PIN domain protein [halophilic archaeon J07HB67]